MQKLIALLTVSLLLIGCVQQAPVPQTPPEPIPEQVVEVVQPEPEPTPEPEVEEGPQTREFSVEAKQWEFNPSTITVNQGDTVKLTIKSVDVTHGIVIPALGIDKRLESGKEVEIEFVADKTGEFPFYCAVFCGRGHKGMTGTVIVE